MAQKRPDRGECPARGPANPWATQLIVGTLAKTPSLDSATSKRGWARLWLLLAVGIACGELANPQQGRSKAQTCADGSADALWVVWRSTIPPGSAGCDMDGDGLPENSFRGAQGMDGGLAGDFEAVALDFGRLVLGSAGGRHFLLRVPAARLPSGATGCVASDALDSPVACVDVTAGQQTLPPGAPPRLLFPFGMSGEPPVSVVPEELRWELRWSASPQTPDSVVVCATFTKASFRAALVTALAAEGEAMLEAIDLYIGLLVHDMPEGSDLLSIAIVHELTRAEPCK